MRTQEAATERNTAAINKQSDLAEALQHATAAKEAAEAQKTKEETWRSWRYCELGGAVAGATLDDDSRAWYQYTYELVADGETAPTWANVPSGGPATCVVPAITSPNDVDGNTLPANQDGTAATRTVRPAVTYYKAKGSNSGELAAEAEDGTSLWSRHVLLTEAEAAESATTAPVAMNTGGATIQRTK